IRLTANFRMSSDSLGSRDPGPNRPEEMSARRLSRISKYFARFLGSASTLTSLPFYIETTSTRCHSQRFIRKKLCTSDLLFVNRYWTGFHKSAYTLCYGLPGDLMRVLSIGEILWDRFPDQERLG